MQNKLTQPVSADFLAFFRIAFGVVMLWWVYKYCAYGILQTFYIDPIHHFKYYGFAWVKPLPGDWPWAEFYVMGVCAFLITVGYFYRYAAIVFAVCFTHIFLVDKALYQNHYYLVCLLSWVMVILPAQGKFSVDAYRNPNYRLDTVPTWMLYLLRFQIGVPYFFGGIAKISRDWLAGQPMGMVLANKTDVPFLGQWVGETWFVYSFVWGGLLFDLLVVPALLWKRTRLIAYLACLAFHLINATVWTIGIFPWMMILATLVFFPPDWPTVLGRRIFRNPQGDDDAKPQAAPRHWRLPSHLASASGVLAFALGAFVVYQCLMPMRHLVIPGNDSWTEEAHYFSWHMLLRGKKPGLRYYGTEPTTGLSGPINLRNHITAHQLRRIGRDPRMIHQLAIAIAEDFAANGIPNIEVRALALVSLNGRRPQLMVDPTINLAAQPVTFGKPSWILDLHEPLRSDPWDVPLEQWEQHISIPPPPQIARATSERENQNHE